VFRDTTGATFFKKPTHAVGFFLHINALRSWQCSGYVATGLAPYNPVMTSDTAAA
jgi:hypothetical protein